MAKKKVVMIYGRKRSVKQFKAFDYKNGVFVGNIIHATFWDNNKKEDVQKMVCFMNKTNPGYVFELRLRS